MSTQADALCTLTQLETALGGADATQTAKREAAIDAATEGIKRYTGREVIHNPGLATQTTEYQDGDGRSGSLILREFPITTFTSLYDDFNRVYGSNTLVPASSYVVYLDEGRLELLTNTLPFVGTTQAVFAFGFQNIKAVYTAGYTNNAAIPADLRQACIEWACWILNTQAATGLSEKSVSLCREVFETLIGNGPPKSVRQKLAAHRSLIAGKV